MAVLGFPSGPIGFIAPLRFKILDSQPDPPNMGPVPVDFHDFRHFQKSCHGFLARYLSCFRPSRPKVGFSSFGVRTQKMREEKLCRFTVVSPREMPPLTVSCPFENSICRPLLKPFSSFCPCPPENAYTNCFRKPYLCRLRRQKYTRQS